MAARHRGIAYTVDMQRAESDQGRQAFISAFFLGFAALGAMSLVGLVDEVKDFFPHGVSEWIGVVFVLGVLIGVPFGIGYLIGRRWQVYRLGPVFGGSFCGSMMFPVGLSVWLSYRHWELDFALIGILLIGFSVRAAMYSALVVWGAGFEGKRRREASLIPTATVNRD